MNDQVLMEKLDEIARKLAIKVIKDRHLRNKGGICRYRDSHYLIYREPIRVSEKIKLYTKAISSVLPEDYYVIPKIRELIETERKKETRFNEQ